MFLLAEKPLVDYTLLSSRREYFLQFAKMKGFNPLVAENWYKFRARDFDPYKVSSGEAAGVKN